MSTEAPKYDHLLDVKGLSCPLPILKTKKAMDSLGNGQILKVEATDPGSRNDIVSWAKRTGNEILKVDGGPGMYIFYIKKNA
jgi:tRNA 2-thiouridine synthesizing protein A